MLIWKVVIHWWVLGVRWEFFYKFSEDKFLLSLGGYEINIEFSKNYGPMSELTIDNSLVEDVLHGIRICNDFSGENKKVMEQLLDYVNEI
jgi:hypothetical protein